MVMTKKHTFADATRKSFISILNKTKEAADVATRPRQPRNEMPWINWGVLRVLLFSATCTMALNSLTIVEQESSSNLMRSKIRS